MTRQVKKMCWILAAVCVFFCANNLLAQTIPTITDLEATAGPNPGEVTLTWSAPLFENPATDLDFDYGMQIKQDTTMEINTGNWDSVSVSNADLPGIGVYCGQITLDLWVMCYSDGTTIYWDEANLRAWLTYQSNAFYGAGLGIPNETINFYVYYPGSTGSLVWSGSATTSNAGLAEIVTTGDIYDGPPTYSANKFHFKATWAGHSIGLVGGIVITTGNKTDTYDMYLYDGEGMVPIAGHWGEWGGVYQYGSLEGVEYSFTVPANTVSADTEVNLSTPTPGSVPPPVGMNLGVPGHMVAFNLEKSVEPQELGNSIVISMTYPPEKLDEYGGLAESSLRGYRYDTSETRWELLDELPLKLNLQQHLISFETDKLGLFAIAAETDADGDKLGDYEEFHFGTNPNSADTDGDGVSDGDEIWLTGGDPLDGKKLDGNDQYAVVRGLTPGQDYYLAARIAGVGGESEVSNCVHINSPCPDNPDINCDNFVDLDDLLALANNWLLSYP